MTDQTTIGNLHIQTSEELTLFKVAAETNQDIIRALANCMKKNGYVKPTFLEAVLEREANMPTGLITKAFGVAIPHSDPEHVNQSAIAVGLLDKPVIFKNMANPQEDVPVILVLLLAIAEKGSVTKVLARLAEAFLNPVTLNKFLTLQNATQLSAYLKGLINGNLEITSS